MNLQFSEQAIASLMTAIISLGFGVMLLAFAGAVYLAARDGVRRLRRLHQIPCHRCAFYTGSPYLKCPVHPSRALSEEAIGCLDYEIVLQKPRRNQPAKPCLEKQLLASRR